MTCQFHIKKSIFHFFNPRSNFSKRNGHHARTRFFERYGAKLTESEYELINLKILLGDYKLIASEDNSSALYSGTYKGIEFLAIFNPYEGMVVTYLELDMRASFLMRKGIEIHCYNFDFLHSAPQLEIDSESFENEKMTDSKLEYFDSFKNISVYRTVLNELVLYDHSNSLILKKERGTIPLNDFLD